MAEWPADGQVDGDFDDAGLARFAVDRRVSDIEGPTKAKPPLVTRAKMVGTRESVHRRRSEEPNVWATIKEHDAVIFQDNDFEVFIDPNGDNHDYFESE